MRFHFTKSAILDFQQIFPGEPLDSLEAMSEKAYLVRTKPNGARVFRCQKLRPYLLVDRQDRVMAVGPPSAAHPKPDFKDLKPGESHFWWRPEPGDVEEEREPSLDRGERLYLAHPWIQQASKALCHLSHGEAARVLGCSRTQWRSLRKGERPPNVHQVEALIKFLAASPLDVADAIRRLRDGLGISRTELAGFMGVAARTLRRFEETGEGVDLALAALTLSRLEAVRIESGAEQILARIDEGMNQEEFAKQIGVHRVTLSRWEREEKNRVRSVFFRSSSIDV